MKALVTGASGFIGQHLVEHLLKNGHDVTVLSRKPFLDKTPFKFCIGDITDSLSLLKATENQDIVYHLAGKIAYKDSERAEMERVNVGGTKKIVDACVTQQTPNFVYMSSVVAIGGSFKPIVMNEKTSYNIEHLNLGYFETKHAAEKIVQQAVAHNKLNAFILNPTTVYGAGDAAKGSRSVQKKVALGKFPFYTPGGVNVVHINDVIFCLTNIFKKGKVGERYIVAGENFSIRQVFEMIAEEAGVSAPKILLPKVAIKILGRLGDFLEPFGLKGPMSRETSLTSTMYHWFTSEKAQKELGFTPTSSRQAIAESVQWMKQNGFLNK